MLPSCARVRRCRGGSADLDGHDAICAGRWASQPTGDGPPGIAVERDLGVALGEVVRSTGAIKTMGAGLKAMRQGEVTQYAQLLEDSPKHAIDRLIENARLLGANAVVAARFGSS